MSSATDVRTLELVEITGRIRAMLDSVEAPASHPVLTPQCMSEFLTELMRAGQCMRRMTAQQEDGSRAVSAYRTQVERLRSLLPSIHRALLGERARLAQEQERLRSINSWAEASQQTL